jgi:hypothetical protein
MPKRRTRGNNGVAKWSIEAIRYQRLLSSGLFRRFAAPKLAASALFGIQSQELNAAALAIWNRVDPLVTADICRNLIAHTSSQSQEDDAQLVRIWGQRGTLHMYAAADWHLVAAVIGEKIIGGLRTAIDKEGLTDEFEAALTATTEQLQVDETATTDASNFQIRFRVHKELASQGIASRVDVCSGRAVLRRRDEEKAIWPSISQSDATRDIALRYFTAYGPATERDLRYWLGVKARQTQVAVAELLAAGEVVRITREDDSGTSSDDDDDQITFPSGEMYAIAEMERPPDVPPVSAWPTRLLGRFEPVLLAHADKTFLIAASGKPQVWAKSAQVHAAVLVDGRLSGRWTKSIKGDSLTVTITPFSDASSQSRLASAANRAAIQVEGDRLATFFECAMPAEVVYE